MTLAINFDAKLGFVAVKIENVRPLWVLATYPISVKLAGAQSAPQEGFRQT
jgi:hypothetical protein